MKSATHTRPCMAMLCVCIAVVNGAYTWYFFWAVRLLIREAPGPEPMPLNVVLVVLGVWRLLAVGLSVLGIIAGVISFRREHGWRKLAVAGILLNLAPPAFLILLEVLNR